MGSDQRELVFIYLCQVYPNTDLGDPAYQRQFGIKTQRIALNEIHATARPQSWVTEYEDIVVETATMSRADWRRMVVFAWWTMLMHSLKLGYFVMLYLYDRLGVKQADLLAHLGDGAFASRAGSLLAAENAAFESMIDRILSGAGRGYDLPGYGGIYWDVEEAAFLRIVERIDEFYSELHDVVRGFLTARGIAFDRMELAEVFRYQRLRIPTRHLSAPLKVGFSRNLPEYFATRFSSAPRPLVPVPQIVTLDAVDFAGNRERFARETILWGRKSGTMLVRARYESLEFPALAAE
ncbi:MAG: hypothetical protein FJX35_19635 [Alphaproteobacteria bacterium]|nr:hypothetical protein [Alphaproteobacteria bacterium]